MKKKKSFIISWKIYPFDVMVNIGMTTDETIKAIERKGYKLNKEEKDLLPMHGRGRTVMLKGGQTIIQLKNDSIDIIVHEVFHAVCFLFEHIDIEFSDSSNEAYAYAIEYLIREITLSINKK